MKCVNCGKQLVDGAAFCMFCGAKAGKKCPKCGQELPDIAMFCYKCGTSLNPNAKSAPKPAAKPAPKNTLNANTMKSLQQVKPQNNYKPTGEPVWDTASDGTRCDCAVGECDCDGSIWN